MESHSPLHSTTSTEKVSQVELQRVTSINSILLVLDQVTLSFYSAIGNMTIFCASLLACSPTTRPYGNLCFQWWVRFWLCFALVWILVPT